MVEITIERHERDLERYHEVDGTRGAVCIHDVGEPCELCEHYRDLSEKVDVVVANPGSGDGLLKGGPRYLTTRALRVLIPESEPIPSTALLYRKPGSGFFTFTFEGKVAHIAESHLVDVPTKKAPKVKKAPAVLEEDEPEAEEAPKPKKAAVGLERWLK